MFELNGKKALVTGSARGIGKAVALCLAKAGADVCVNYVSERSAQAAQAVADEIKAMGRNAVAIRADVSIEADVQRLMEETANALGGIDILVNNAGVNSNFNIYNMEAEEFERIFRNNMLSGFLCSKYVIPYMKKNNWGRIIMMASLTGQQGALFGQVHYSSTKGAQVSFAKTLARTVAADGITVNCIAPGVHMTDTLRDILVNSDPHRMDSTIERTPLGRIGTCEDIGHAAVFLASEEANFITGATIDVNGGLYMR